MDITVYRAKEGCFVLIPEVFQPSMACRQLFETLVECGQVSFADALLSDRWSRVIVDIERDTYAVLTAHAAAELFGPDHACLGSGKAVERTAVRQVPSVPLSVGPGSLAWESSES